MRCGDGTHEPSFVYNLARRTQIILIGDHNQLPPVVKNQAFQKYSRMDQPLFTRFIRLGVPYTELSAQGRARPAIAQLYTWRYRALGDLPHVLNTVSLAGRDCVPAPVGPLACHAVVSAVASAPAAVRVSSGNAVPAPCSAVCLIQSCSLASVHWDGRAVAVRAHSPRRLWQDGT